MKKLLITILALFLTFNIVFAQSDSLEVAKTKSKSLINQLFMFSLAKDVLETRQLISDNVLGDSVENYMTHYDNALFFVSKLDYDFFWNDVFGRTKYRVPSSKTFLDTKESFLSDNEVKTSIDFDIVLTPQWQDPAKEDKVKDYKVKITPGNYTNLTFTDEQKTGLNTALNKVLIDNPNPESPNKAKVNEAVFDGLDFLANLLEYENINKELFIFYNNQQYDNNDSIFITEDIDEITLHVESETNLDVPISWEGANGQGVEAIVDLTTIGSEGKNIKVKTSTNSTIVKIFPLKKIIKINDIDEYFAPTVENLNITYSLYSDTLKHAKIEIFKKGDNLNPIYKKESITHIGENINISWDGIMNVGQSTGKYVSVFDSPYTIKISATYDKDGNFDKSVDDSDITKVELESIILSPDRDLSLVKPNVTALEVEQEIEATINVKNKQKKGVVTSLPFVVHFSFEDPDDISGKNIIDGNGLSGNDNTLVSNGGKSGTNSIMWKPYTGYISRINFNKAESDVMINNQLNGKTKILFTSSIISGDNYIIVAQIKDPVGNVLKEEKTGNWTVRKSVRFTNIYEMAGSFSMQQIMSFSNVDPAFSGDGCTDYSLNSNNINTLSTVLSPEYIAPLLPPIPLVDPVTGQPNSNAEIPTAQELLDYSGSDATKKLAAEIVIKSKAQAWFNRNNNNLGVSKNTYLQQARLQTPSIIGARYYHPKLDGRSSTGLTNYYPSGITINAANGNNPSIIVDPDDDWRIVQGFNDSQGNTWMFLNINNTLRQQIVARHEVGHASDHTSFGNGDHAQTGLMHYSADMINNPPYGDPNFSDDSINKLRGRK